MTATSVPLASTRDVTAALGRAVLGVSMIGVGWYQASDRFELDDQAPWLALAIGGLLVAAAGGIGWILALRRRVADQMASLYGTTSRLTGPGVDVVAIEAVAELVVLRAGDPKLFHLDTCAFVRDRPVRPTTVESERRSGREPCGACGV